MPNMKKKCSVCKEVKPISEYSKKKGTKDGLASACKICKNIQHAEWRKNNPDTVKEMNLKYYTGCTLEKYNQLFKEQEGRCAICGRHQSEFKKALAVDHDHNTGKIRALLCNKCNTGLGQFNDSIVLMLDAIEYIKMHKEND